MLFACQLEPDGLIKAFAVHPPEGFALLEGGGPAGAAAPAFSAAFDLLTTAEPALKRRAAALPLFRYWSRWLRIRTAFVGTTVSEYALLPHTGSATAQVQSLLRRWGGDFRLLIVKDLPGVSPLLGAADNARAEALLRACMDAGFVLVEGQALAYVAIDFEDVDTYLRRLSASRRQNLRRKLRSRAALQITRLPTGSACFADDAVVDAYYALYGAVFAQSDIHFDQLTRDFFAAVLRDGASGGVVFEYRQAGVLVGWNLCFEAGGKLVDKYIGFRYPEARACNLYFVSWMVNLEYAIERRLTHYVAGWTDPEVKAQLGASFTFTRHAVYVRNPVLRRLARRFAGHFEGDRAWQEASV
ncbi:GNAT family N-acetyltransferase [Rhodoferax koreense]|uniref:GNAT family N-acetyltransferase n=1 Tax=Rhodoferax koreensis TaxID=1842727 RepID=A0A1P8JS28_9BURK|nr:GNAT family N-acetyltransferase [Rhodoferax koreense]APW36562.1 GNAT family N-acetyltransferase [Rhodoferax koreense]